jgi:hypothetical protein
MKEKRYLVLLFLTCFSITAQIKGFVVDDKNQPIPYVNIWVENENIGTTSNEDGTFNIDANADKVLVFSAVGYESLKTKVAAGQNVVLQIAVQQLKEVFVRTRTEKEKIEINKYNNKEITSFHFANNRPTIIAKYIQNSAVIEEHPFLKKITFLSNCQTPTAKIKIRFYNVAVDGNPGEDYSTDHVIVSVKKGKRSVTIDLSDKNISIPKEGLFLAFEWMIIDENKYTYNYTFDSNNVKQIGALYDPKKKIYTDGQDYQPYIGTVRSDEFSTWHFIGGKWNKIIKRPENSNSKNRYTGNTGDLAVKLTLTN